MEYYTSPQGQASGYLGQGGIGAPMLDPSASAPQGEGEWPREQAGGSGGGVASRSGLAGVERETHSLSQALFQISLQDAADTEYPQRPGMQDCSHYLRTGTCAYGKTCKFNHPPNRRQARVGAIRGGGASGGSPLGGGLGPPGVFPNKMEYPERQGEPDCQFYLKTGTCKFGASCKYNHPRDHAGGAGKVALNAAGYPLRPGEKECAFYMRHGECKFSTTCKFHHPHLPGGIMPDSPQFGGTPSSASPQMAGMPWPLARPYMTGPRMAGPGGFAPMVLPPPPGVVALPGWIQNSLAPIGSDPASGQFSGTPSFVFGPHSDPSMVGPFSAFPPSPMAAGPSPTSQGSPQRKEHHFPERQGEAECQYYLKTGDCKYGMTCKYHHPRDRAIPPPTAVFSMMGLPLRPGATPCSFYLRNGFCKFGPTCKFDHPLREFPPEMSVGPYPFPPHLAPPSNTSNLESETKNLEESAQGQYRNIPEVATSE